MEVSGRFILVGLLLLALLGGAIAYSLWPQSESGERPPEPVAAGSEPRRKSVDEQLAELERDTQSVDAGSVVLRGVVQSSDGKPIPGAEVWVTAEGEGSALDQLHCDVCGEPLSACEAASTARQAFDLARRGRLARPELGRTRADAAGRFLFPVVPNVLVRVHARAKGFADGDELTDPEFLDEIDSAAATAPVPGEPEQPLDVVVRLSASRPLRLRVLDTEGEPVQQARVAALSPATGTVIDRVADALGRVELPGGGDTDSELWMLVEAPGFLPYSQHGAFYNDEPDEEPTVELHRPHRLRVETRLLGKPVDASVELLGQGHPRRAVAQAGVAVFEDLSEEGLELVATFGNYVSPKQYVDLHQLETTARVDLRPAARLSVGVFDAAGEPVSGARVSIAGYGNTDMKSTEDNGALVIFEGLAEGSYQVEVEADGLRDAQRRVDVRAGDNHLEVVLPQASVLSGKVVDAKGEAVANASVELVTQIHNLIATATNEEGAFELQVDEPGSYRLRARQWQKGQLVTQVEAPAKDLVLQLDLMGRIEVRVLADGKPLPDVMVSFFGTAGSADDSGNANTDERGVATMAGLQGGTYVINTELPGFRRPDQRTVKLAPNGRAELTIVLERGAQIRGKVVDENGKPVPNAEVRPLVIDLPQAETAKQLEPGDPDLMIGTAYTDESGEFILGGLKPGKTYQLTSQADGKASRAPVAAKAPSDGVVIKLQPLPAVAARVVDESGRPIPSFRVDGLTFNSADGRFSLGREPDSEGKIYLDIESDGYRVLIVERPYAPDLGDLTLAKASVIKGVVVDAQGQGVWGADVTCDVCSENVTSAADGSFSVTVVVDPADSEVEGRAGSAGLEVHAEKLNQRGVGKVPRGGNSVLVRLEPPIRVEGVVKDSTGRPVSARITVREINGSDEQRLDSGPDGRFALDLSQGTWMFITRLAASGQTVRVVPPKVFVTLGAPPGTCAVTITVTEPVGDAWLVPLEPDRVPLDSLDDDSLYGGAVALDLPLPNRPSRSAGLQCGVYTLITSDSSGVRKERVDVRAAESVYALPPAPPPTEEAEPPGAAPGQPAAVPGQPAAVPGQP